MSLITVKSYQNLTEAHIARSLLQSEGIPCYLADEYLANLVPHYNYLLNGIKLQTHTIDAARALEIIEQSETRGLECPHCESNDVIAHTTSFKGWKGKLSLLAAFFIMIFPFYYQQGHRCKNCGNDFSVKL